MYGYDKRKEVRVGKDVGKGSIYDPKLPTNVIDNGMIGNDNVYRDGGKPLKRSGYDLYEPKLPTNVIDKTIDALYLEHPPSDNRETVMELKKTEYIYVFYEKLPFYDISSHKHKFIKHYPCRKGQEEGCIYGKVKKIDAKGYDPQLPTNLIEEYEPPLPNNVMRIKSVKKGLHPTQKPVSIIERILKYYSKPGWNVLDMCCGSGSTGVACKNMGRNFIGIELDKKIFDICKKRLDNEIV